MIDIRGLTKCFGNVTAIDNLSIDFRPGVTGVVGENGAGKSTLFRLIAGVYEPTSGQIDIDGDPSNSVSAKQKVFFLSDSPYFPHGANPDGIVSFYSGLCPVDKKRFFELLQDFGLPTDRSIGTFSKGMRRQLFIALSLSIDCQYLLMDEAFDGLDPLVVEKIKGEIIMAGESGKTVIISSHNIPVLEKLVDRFVLLHKGKLGKEGEKEDIGTEFVKFQGAFPSEVKQEDFENLNFQVVSFKKVGSIYHVVLINQEAIIDKINGDLHPIFFESVPIDPDELLVLEMMFTKKGGK